MRGTSAEPARSTSRTAPRDSLMTRAMPRRLCPCSCSLRIATRVLWSSMAHVPPTQPERTNPFDQPKAGLLVGARQRNQILFRGMRHDFASTHTFLNRFRQFAHQGQAPADPTDRASEPTGQLFLGQLKSPVEFHEQPALLQRRFRFPGMPQPTHHQSFRLAALPAEATHGVAAETAQGTHPLVAIDHYKVFITILLHHHDRNLLADFGERAQQSSLVIRVHDPQPVVTQFQLMKFQLHPFRLRQNQNTTRISSCARYPPSAPLSPVDSRK